MDRNLCLLWQDVKIRSWYHVGNLTQKSNEIFSFSYSKGEEYNKAINAGYKGHPSFPDHDKEYTSDKLFSAFSRRIPSEGRKDYSFLFENFEVENDPFKLLEITGGVLYGDNYEFVKPIEGPNNLEFEVNCFLRGWRHWNSEDDVLKGEVMLSIEEKNEYDKNAVCVLKTSEGNKKVGYIPAFYSSNVKNALKNGRVEVTYKFFDEAIPQYKVRMELKCEIIK